VNIFFINQIAWDDDILCSKIQDKSAKTNQMNYFKKREIAIHKSEQKFRKEYLKDINDLNFYNSTLKKIQVYNEKMHIFEETTVKKLNNFKIIIF